MKKSQTTSKSSAKTAKLSAKKTGGTSLKAAGKTLNKPSKSKAVKKMEAGAKASASLPKAIAKKIKPTPVSPAKAPFKKTVAAKAIKSASLPKAVAKKIKPTPVSSAKAPTKKTVTGKATKPSVKTLSKKPLKAVKAPAKLSKTKAKPVTAAAVSKIKKPKAPEIRKTAASKPLVTKPIKSSEKIEKTIKKAGKKTVKTISAAKSLTPAKKPAKELPAKTIAPITRIANKKTLKSIDTKKSSAKVKKVAAGKSEEKTAKSIKFAASAEGSAKAKKGIAEKLKPVPEKKPMTAETVPQIKVPVKQKAILKPTEKGVSSLSPRSKSVEKKGTSQKTIETYVASSQAETRQKKSTQLKVFLPEEELPPEEAQITPSPKLPEEFGENELLLMEVDPAIVFVSWEIKPDCISCKTGKLTLRVYDVTGLEFDGSNANSFFDIALGKRVDSKFIDIKMPGRDVIMEIGLLQPEGPFEPIKRSNRVSMPALRTWDEMGITGSWSGPNTLIGY